MSGLVRFSLRHWAAAVLRMLFASSTRDEEINARMGGPDIAVRIPRIKSTTTASTSVKPESE